MDKQGLFAEGPAWDSVKTVALAARPDVLTETPFEDALSWLGYSD